jgi:cardiolipin synthase
VNDGRKRGRVKHAVRRWRERLRRVPRTGKSTHNSVRLLHDGAQALPAMLAAIAGAKEEVLLEMYWFGSDKTGRQFAAALIERARAGVCVRVIYDALGSIEAGVAMFDEMQSHGVEVFEFNPIAPWRRHFRFARINNRDHRKLLVIDGQLAITGGFNLGDPWAPRDQGGQGWRDDGVEVHGSAALSMRALFYRTFPARPLALSPKLLNEGDTEVTVLASEFHAERRDIYDGYINAIARATRDIIITNSYFVTRWRGR